jgi:hypothetical protein
MSSVSNHNRIQATQARRSFRCCLPWLIALSMSGLLVGCQALPDCKTLSENLKEDSSAYRACVVKQSVADFMRTHAKPGDALIDLMPEGTTEIELVNPGFDFTYENGQKVPNGTWITPIQEGEPGSMRRFNQSLGLSDPILGWSSIGCSGVEATRRFNTMPDIPTAYMVAHGKDYTLHQTLENHLQPNTCYTLVVEVYARNDYRAPKPNEMLLFFTDEEDKPVQTSRSERVLTTTDPQTGFTVAIIRVTTHATQPEGDLRVHLGINAEGNVRVNYDNIRIWQQPVTD